MEEYLSDEYKTFYELFVEYDNLNIPFNTFFNNVAGFICGYPFTKSSLWITLYRGFAGEYHDKDYIKFSYELSPNGMFTHRIYECLYLDIHNIRTVFEINGYKCDVLLNHCNNNISIKFIKDLLSLMLTPDCTFDSYMSRTYRSYMVKTYSIR